MCILLSISIKMHFLSASYGSFSLERDIFYAIINQIGTSPQTKITVKTFSSGKKEVDERKCCVQCKCTFFSALWFLSSTRFEWQNLCEFTKWRNGIPITFRRCFLYESWKKLFTMSVYEWFFDHKTFHLTNCDWNECGFKNCFVTHHTHKL